MRWRTANNRKKRKAWRELRIRLVQRMVNRSANLPCKIQYYGFSQFWCSVHHCLMLQIAQPVQCTDFGAMQCVH